MTGAGKLSAAEEIPDPIQPALRTRAVALDVGLADDFKFLQQFLLPVGELGRGFQHDMAEQVAVAGGAYALDALAAQAEDLAGLRFGRHLELGDAVERGNFDFAAESRNGKN